MNSLKLLLSLSAIVTFVWFYESILVPWLLEGNSLTIANAPLVYLPMLFGCMFIATFCYNRFKSPTYETKNRGRTSFGNE